MTDLVQNKIGINYAPKAQTETNSVNFHTNNTTNT